MATERYAIVFKTERALGDLADELNFNSKLVSGLPSDAKIYLRMAIMQLQNARANVGATMDILAEMGED